MGPESQRLALVVDYTLTQPRQATPAIREFLESRKSRQPGTLQFLLVIRSTSGAA